MRPLFLEITAEMLKYINFVEKTDFVYLGDTKGNSERFIKDMDSMFRGQKVDFGIMSLQAKYRDIINRYIQKKQTTAEVSKFIQNVIDEKISMSDLDNEQWLFIKSILRSRKPYYLMGLDEYSQNFLEEYNKENIPKPASLKVKKKNSETTKEINFYTEIANNIDIQERNIIELFLSLLV